MENHSLIKASRGTHGKIVALAVAVSVVFVAFIAAYGVTRSDGARTAGPIVKAKATVTIARGETAPPRASLP